MTSDVSLDRNEVKQVRDRSLWTGVVLAIFGLVAIVLPVVSTIFVETWVAIILASAGATKLFYAYQTRAQGGTLWKVLLGILYIATGIMLFINPRIGILTLTLLLGSFLLTEGVFELILAFKLRPQQNWTWALGNGIVTLLLGAMIWFQFPFDAPWLLGTLVGASILFTGISRIGLSFKAREVLNNESESTASA